MNKLFLIIALIALAYSASAANTNIGSHTITTTHLLAEGRASIGTTHNLSEYQLYVTNHSLFGGNVFHNGSVTIGDRLYVNGTSTFNGTVTGIQGASIISGTVARARLPGEIAYEDEANVFTLRQIYDAGFTAGANAYFTALLQANSTLAAQAFAYINQAAQVNGTFIAQENAYFNDQIDVNETLFATKGIRTTVNESVTRNWILDGSTSGNVFIEIRGNTENRAPSIWFMNGPTSATDIVGRITLDRLDTPIFSGAGQNDFVLGTTQSEPTMLASNGIVRLEVKASGEVRIVNALEIDGSLDHDGASAGFFGTTPVAQQACVAAASGGAVIDTQARTAANGALAALKALGLMAGGC